MAGELSLRIKTDMESAQADFKKMAAESEYLQQKIAKLKDGTEEYANKQLKQFTDKTELSTIAIKATQGATAAMAAETRALQSEIAKLIRAGVDPSSDAVKTLEGRYKDLTAEVKANEAAHNAVSKAISVAKGTILGIGAAIMAAGGYALKTAAANEDMIAAFIPLMQGDEEAATSLFKAIQKEADSTPFEIDKIAASVKTLMPVFAGSAEESVAAFRMIGDTAQGNAQKLESITRAYTQSMLKNKVSMNELNTIAGAGVPIYTELAKSMGVSEAEMMKMVGSGKVGAKDLTKVFEQMTSEGGVFYQGMDIASQTFSMQIMGVTEKLGIMAGVVGERMLPAAKEFMGSILDIISGITDWIQEGDNFDDMVSILKTVAWGVGAVGAAFLAYTGYVKAAAAWTAINTVITEIAAVVTGKMTLAQWELTAAMLANPAGLVIAAIAALIVVGIALYKNWDKVKEKFVNLWESIKYYSAVGAEYVSIAYQKMVKFLTEAIFTAAKPFFWYIDNIITAFNAITGQQIPKLSTVANNYLSTFDQNIAKSQANIAKLHTERMKQLDTLAAKTTETNEKITKSEQKKKDETIKAAVAKSEKEKSLLAAQTEHFAKALELMANNEAASNAKRYNDAIKFFTEKADLEKVSDEELNEWRAAQDELIKNNTLLSVETRKLAEEGLSKAIENIHQKNLENEIKIHQKMLSNVDSMVSDLQTIFQNAGKKSKALAIAGKGVAAAEAAINSYLAFTQALTAPPGPPFTYPMAAIALAAGLAKQAAILSTPISAETGLKNYTVPDIRQYRNDSYPVRAQAGEHVSVTPRGGNSGETTSIHIQIGEETLFKVIQKGINTGKIKLTDRQIGKGVFV